MQSKQKIDQLLEVPAGDRDEAWEKDFLAELPKATVKVLMPEPREGPDGWPYLLVSTGEGADEPLISILNWLSSKGIGLALNSQKAVPDFVLSYGMVWNFRERGEFLTEAKSSRAGAINIESGQQVLTGAPSAQFLPSYARGIIKQFLLEQSVLAPKVLMVSFDTENFDLCFSIESLKSPPEKEHASIAEALSWFVPAHYAVSLVSEKAIPGFQPL
jgi:hypothetical protein